MHYSVNYLDVSRLSLFVALLFSFSFVHASSLDGNVYVGSIGLQGEAASGTDELQFANGELYSTGCAEWGFKAGVYDIELVGDGINFTATTLSPDDGKIVWDGAVRGDELEATFTWTKERWWWRDAHQVKWFKGTLKPK